MENYQDTPSKLKKAIKRLAILKGFYSHLVVYLIFNLLGLLIFMIYGLTNLDKWTLIDPNLKEWLGWNLLLTPLLWGIGLFFHWLYVFRKKPKFLRDWEERKIKKYMER